MAIWLGEPYVGEREEEWSDGKSEKSPAEVSTVGPFPRWELAGSGLLGIVRQPTNSLPQSQSRLSRRRRRGAGASQASLGDRIKPGRTEYGEGCPVLLRLSAIGRYQTFSPQRLPRPISHLGGTEFYSQTALSGKCESSIRDFLRKIRTLSDLSLPR